MRIIIIVLGLTGLGFLSYNHFPESPPTKSVWDRKFKKLIGINTYEWNVCQNAKDPGNVLSIFTPKFDLFKPYSGIRHYLDWEKIENVRGEYTFNPAKSGGWNYDTMYHAFKLHNQEILTCLKQCPDFIVKTCPKNIQFGDNVPAPYGLDRLKPATYILQAKAAFQFAARYGSNKKVNPDLVKVSHKIRWNQDPENKEKIGLGYVRYIECDNERDKWWRGKQAQQNGAEYAANLSAFYDGDQGRLGKNVGVKTADPNMKVVMCGLSVPTTKFVEDMVDWCKIHRGLNPDGSINLCFDVINYHYYSNDYNPIFREQATRGVAPELGSGQEYADNFVNFSKTLKNALPVWVTELGYDLNQGSPQKAIPIGKKTAEITQADWLLRTSLLLSRAGVERAFFYQEFDDNPSAGQYSTCGLNNEITLKRRAAGDFMLQVSELMGNYSYKRNLSKDPEVDEYVLGNKSIFVCWIPDEAGRIGTYTLNVNKSAKAILHQLRVGYSTALNTPLKPNSGQLIIPVSETPVFVEIL